MSSLFTKVDSFAGIYEFLALEYPCEVYFCGNKYPSAQHALLDAQYIGLPEEILQSDDGAAARESVANMADLKEREDWKILRLRALEMILRDKFLRHPELKKLLVDTGDRTLEWLGGDAFWGITIATPSIPSFGQNQLGRGLAAVRLDARLGRDQDQWLAGLTFVEHDENLRPLIHLLEEKPGAPEHNHRYELDGKASFTLGKLEENDVPARHPSVSRKHALIVLTKQGVIVIDLQSKAGTKVNDKQIPAFVTVKVEDGDTIALGASTRYYTVKVDYDRVMKHLESTARDLHREVGLIQSEVANPSETAARQIRAVSTIFVGNLDFTTTERDLRELFENVGNLVEVRFPGDGKGKGGKGAPTSAVRGIAFCVFDSAMAAQKAINKTGEEVLGRKIKVNMAEQADKGKGNKGGGKGAIEERRPNSGTDKEVFVGNLSFDVTRAEIRQFFEPAGHVVEIRLPGSVGKSEETAAAKGIAFVVFQEPLQADAAVALTGSELKGRALNIRLSDPRSAPMNGPAVLVPVPKPRRARSESAGRDEPPRKSSRWDKSDRRDRDRDRDREPKREREKEVKVDRDRERDRDRDRERGRDRDRAARPDRDRGDRDRDRDKDRRRRDREDSKEREAREEDRRRREKRGRLEEERLRRRLEDQSSTEADSSEDEESSSEDSEPPAREPQRRRFTEKPQGKR
mmetsp:Transcript_5012/g.12291  ORF Transcript_5012/g.12291 Transcript_5012/m.12291 type:complete len:688 (-) Transcript_5012:35-2098(-)